VSEVWVANTSPVIVLAKAGYLNFLTELSTELLLAGLEHHCRRI
jgi:hypothetical protein